MIISLNLNDNVDTVQAITGAIIFTSEEELIIDIYDLVYMSRFPRWRGIWPFKRNYHFTLGTVN